MFMESGDSSTDLICTVYSRRDFFREVLIAVRCDAGCRTVSNMSQSSGFSRALLTQGQHNILILNTSGKMLHYGIYGVL